ncbi:hypothetical protein [Aureispira sp. CCB-QB1]|uniref:hypothetical protein n=1 Tax=Aureispira sp. CCB-QB1 TaxID=1313421 RepID=UPI0012DE4068|nr:hypothetical protein [Aureispira sp. CCB-QB1]
MKLNNLIKSQNISLLWLFLVTMLTLGVVVPLDTTANYFLSSHAITIMLLFLGTGFVGFVLRNNTIIFPSFLACIVLCTFIKESLTQEFTYSTPTDDIEVRVAHLVLDDKESITAFAQSFSGLEADFLSIQTPIEPTLELRLTQELGKKMPYWNKTICNNNTAMFIFSSYELKDLDTVYYNGNQAVSLVGSMFIDSTHDQISFLSTRVPVDRGLRQETEKHLERLSQYINNNFQDKPLLTLSGTKLASWTPELQEFRTAHRLNDSEMDLELRTRDEHIFYSKDLVCTGFSNILDGNGVLATYQFRTPKKTAYNYKNDTKGAAL